MVTRQPVGAEIVSDGRVHFRVWAPKHREVAVVLEAGSDAPRAFALEPEAEGYFAGAVAGACGGTRYRFRLGGSSVKVLPDPVSRYQPEGPCGPSEVIDPLCFRWTDQAWQGIFFCSARRRRCCFRDRSLPRRARFLTGAGQGRRGP